MVAIYRDRALAEAVVEKLRTYAQPQRLMILSCLREGERTVGEIDAVTGIGQPALSQQLAELRSADMVKSRRVSKQVYYALADDSIRQCVCTMEAIFGGASQPDATNYSSAVASVSRGAGTPPAASAQGAAAFARIG